MGTDNQTTSNADIILYYYRTKQKRSDR